MAEQLDISLVESQLCAIGLCSGSKKWIGGTQLEHSPYSPDLDPCDFWASRTMKRELQCKKFQSDQRSAARFREVSGA
jgi:hypothetical protein